MAKDVREGVVAHQCAHCKNQSHSAQLQSVWYLRPGLVKLSRREIKVKSKFRFKFEYNSVGESIGIKRKCSGSLLLSQIVTKQISFCKGPEPSSQKVRESFGVLLLYFTESARGSLVSVHSA